jgi:hypothetical protein
MLKRTCNNNINFYLKPLTKIFKLAIKSCSTNTEILLRENNINNNNKTEKLTLENLENILVKLTKLEMDLENLPDNLLDYRKDLQAFITKHKIIDPDACCNTGCANCIMNEYEENMHVYVPDLKNLCNKINSQNLV